MNFVAKKTDEVVILEVRSDGSVAPIYDNEKSQTADKLLSNESTLSKICTPLEHPRRSPLPPVTPSKQLSDSDTDIGTEDSADEDYKPDDSECSSDESASKFSDLLF